MNLKKLLSITGLLNIIVPTSLSITACNYSQINDKDFNIINDIDKINNLEIFITSKEENETIFNILNNPTLGIAEVIANNQDIDKDFKKELFKLDLENIYFDKDKINIINKEQNVIVNTIYYFQYTYNNKKNNILIPVKITKISEKIIIENINKINYKQNITVNTTINQLTKKLDYEFIKSKLDDNLKIGFENNLFKIQEIKENNKTLTDHDFKEPKQILAKLVYSYGEITNQETNLTINIYYSKLQIIEEINKIEYKANVIVETKAQDLIKRITTKDFIKSGINNIKLKNSFNEKEFHFIMISKKNNKEIINNNDLKKIQKINAVIDYKYQDIFGKIKLTINVQVPAAKIVNAINKNYYNTEVKANTNIEKFKKTINPSFISTKLIGDIKKSFNPEALIIYKITLTNNDNNKEKELESKDLIKIRTFKTKINYFYKYIEEKQETFLFIKITE